MPKTETETDIRDRIRPVKEVPLYLKALLYGRSGTGKTTLAGTFPGPILVVDIREKGTASLFNREDVDVFEVESWNDFEEIYYYLVAGDHDYKTVVVDTVTPLQDLALHEVVGEDIGNISRRAWGEASSLMKSWIMLYRDLPMNVVFTAQDRTRESEESDEEGMLMPEVGPYLMPSVAKILNASVGIIGQTFLREVPVRDENNELIGHQVQYCLRIGPHPRYLTKLRRDSTLVTESLPEVISNPTYTKLMKLSTQNIVKKKKVKENGTAASDAEGSEES